MIIKIDKMNHFRKLIGYPDLGDPVTEEEFNNVLNSWPHVKRTNFCGSSVYSTSWMGKEKIIGSFNENKKQYFLRKEN